MDEKACRKEHRYFTLVNNPERGRVLYIAENWTHESLDGFWPTLNEAQRTGIRAIAMDMWDLYVRSVRENLDGGTGLIAFDKFHIAKHLGDALDRVRRQEHKILKAAGDDQLKGRRYCWLRHPAGM